MVNMIEERIGAEAAVARTSHEVSLVRLYLIRAMFLLIFLGEGSIIWPLLLHHPEWSLMHSVAIAMLAALTALCALGVRYPLQMLPLLLFELTWKTIFVLGIALPLWSSHAMTPEFRQSTIECLVGVILCPLVIPWGYVWRAYVKRPGDRWTNSPAV
jgi:hypothetical protein